MSTLIALAVSLGGTAALAGLVFLLARFGATQAAKSAETQAHAEIDREATEAERRAGAVLGEHRDRADTVDRLSSGRF